MWMDTSIEVFPSIQSCTPYIHSYALRPPIQQCRHACIHRRVVAYRVPCYNYRPFISPSFHHCPKTFTVFHKRNCIWRGTGEGFSQWGMNVLLIVMDVIDVMNSAGFVWKLLAVGSEFCPCASYRACHNTSPCTHSNA